jgi:hypothetical protein
VGVGSGAIYAYLNRETKELRRNTRKQLTFALQTAITTALDSGTLSGAQLRTLRYWHEGLAKAGLPR